VSVFAGIDILLHRVLEQVRDHILSIVKPEVETAFETLRASLECGTSTWSYAALNSAIADVIPEVQAAIDRVCEWFVPVGAEQEVGIRTIEQIVDIGIEATRTAHKGFSPMIEREIEDIGVQSALILSDITDILLTVLDNVYCHSGNRVSPWVKLRVSSEGLDAGHCKTTIRIESEVATGTYTEERRSRLDRIKEQMASGEYRKHVNLDGGTGLLKLKRLVSSDERQSLDFGFVGEHSFFVNVIPSSIEPLFWLVIFVICAYVIAKQARKVFLHGLLLGLANSVWITAAHILLFNQYIATHARARSPADNFLYSFQSLTFLSTPPQILPSPQSKSSRSRYP